MISRLLGNVASELLAWAQGKLVLLSAQQGLAFKRGALARLDRTNMSLCKQVLRAKLFSFQVISSVGDLYRLDSPNNWQRQHHILNIVFKQQQLHNLYKQH